MKKTEVITINITQEIIDRAEHMKLCSCPFALAINGPLTAAHNPRREDASVHLRGGHFTLAEILDHQVHRTIYEFELPDNARRFVSDWDARKTVKPFEFEITAKFKGPKANGSNSTL